MLLSVSPSTEHCASRTFEHSNKATNMGVRRREEWLEVEGNCRCQKEYLFLGWSSCLENRKIVLDYLECDGFWEIADGRLCGVKIASSAPGCDEMFGRRYSY